MFTLLLFIRTLSTLEKIKNCQLFADEIRCLILIVHNFVNYVQNKPLILQYSFVCLNTDKKKKIILIH